MPKNIKHFNKLTLRLYFLSFLILFASIFSSLLFFTIETKAAPDELSPANIQRCFDKYKDKNVYTGTTGGRTPVEPTCKQICRLSDDKKDIKYICADPTIDDTKPSIDAPREYGSAVGSAVCTSKIAQEKASCIDIVKVATIDCIKDWVVNGPKPGNYPTDEEALYGLVDTNYVGMCVAKKTGYNAAKIIDALNKSVKKVAETEKATEKILDEQKECKAKDGKYEDGECKEKKVNSCTIDGVGWIVCPTITFLSFLNDQAYGQLSNLLEVEPSLIQNKGVKKAWETFRDIANVTFVIALLAIVYSQLAGGGNK